MPAPLRIWRRVLIGDSAPVIKIHIVKVLINAARRDDIAADASEATADLLVFVVNAEAIGGRAHSALVLIESRP